MMTYHHHLRVKILICTLYCLFCGAIVASEQENYQTRYGFDHYFGIITPSDVYAVVENINLILLNYAQQSPQYQRIQSLAYQQIKQADPKDVLAALHRLRKRLNQHLSNYQLPTIPKVVPSKKIIPANVYLQASYILDALVQLKDKIEPHHSWGHYYKIHRYQVDKKPADVLSAVHLGLRRIQLIDLPKKIHIKEQEQIQSVPQ